MPEESIAKHPFRAWTVLLLTLLFLIPAGALISPSSGSGSGDAQTAPPTRQTWLDIAIDDIRVNKPTQSNNLYPGQTVRIDIHLKHDDRPYISDIPITRANGNQFTVVMVVDDGFDNVTTKYSQVTSMTLNYTGADQPGAGARNPPLVISFSWDIPLRPPSGQSWSTFQFNIYTTITVDDDDKSDNFRSGSGVRVSEPEFAPFIWEEGQDEKKYESPIPHSVNVGEVLFVPFELQNQGPAIDIIGIKVLSKPDGWNVEGFQPRTVYPNDFELLQLPVQVSRDPFQAKSDEGYPIIVKAYSTLYAGPYNLPAEHTFRFEVRKKPGVDLRPVSESVYLIPGTQTNVYFNLYNRGNFEDDYTLNAKVDDVHIRKGWRVDFASGTKLPSDVRPGAEEPFRVITKITVPEDAPYHYNVILVLSISSNNMDYSSESDPCILFVDARYAASFEDIPDPIPVEPGQVNNFTIMVSNDGNTNDPALTMETFYRPKGWMVYYDRDLFSGIGPRSTINVPILVIVEETTISSSHGSMSYIDFRLRGSPNDHVLAETRIYFDVALHHRAELKVLGGMKTGENGTTVEYELEITNKGNWQDTFNLTPRYDWVHQEIMIGTQEIAPGETLPLKVFVDIPYGFPADGNLSTPDPDENGFYDPHYIELVLTSQNDTSVVTEAYLPLLIIPFESHRLKKMDLEPLDILLGYSRDLDIPFRLINDGNVKTRVNLSLDGAPAWMALVRKNIELGFGANETYSLKVKYEKNTLKAESIHTIDLIGRIAGTSDDRRSREITFTFQFHRYLYSIIGMKLNQVEVNRATFMQVTEPYPLNSYHSLSVRLRFHGMDLPLPRDAERPELVLRLNGYETSREEVPEPDDSGYCWVDLGVFTLNMSGPVEVNITIEGLASDPGALIISHSVMVQVERSPLKEDDGDSDSELIYVVIELGILLALLLSVLLFVMFVRRKAHSGSDHEE